LGGIIFLGVLGSLGVWLAKGVPDTPLVWSLRILLPLIVIASAAGLIRAMRRPDLAPDFLRQLVGQPFERDGGCFVIVPSKRGGGCYMNVIFQNQYEKPCHLRVVVQPPAKSFTLGKRPFEGIAVDIPCSGGGFGIARVPIGIPTKFQGQNQRFEVAAATNYPQGRGALLRFRNGVRVGKADSSGMGSAAVAIGLLAVGVISISRPASTTLLLPSGVAEAIPPSARPDMRTLWSPDADRLLTIDDLQQAMDA
jgi:hypothetical protein